MASKALELAADTDEIVNAKKINDGRFAKGDPRTIEAGRKGGKAPHVNGSKTGMAYKYKGFTISWDKQRHLWRAKDEYDTLYARSYREATASVRETIEKREAYIEEPKIEA